MLLTDIFEDRIKGANYTEKKAKGAIDRVIVELKGQTSAAWTRISRQYAELDTAIKELELQKTRLNAELKDKAADVFDAADAVFTRVIETSQLTITLSKKTKIPAGSKVNAEKVVEQLAAADLPKELRKLVNGIIKANTTLTDESETPERLSVKVKAKLDEGVGARVRGILTAVKGWLQDFDRKYLKVAELVEMMSVHED